MDASHRAALHFFFFCRLITARCSSIAQVELTETHRGWTTNFFLEQRFHRTFNLMFLYLWGLVLFPLRKLQRKKIRGGLKDSPSLFVATQNQQMETAGCRNWALSWCLSNCLMPRELRRPQRNQLPASIWTKAMPRWLSSLQGNLASASV